MKKLALLTAAGAALLLMGGAALAQNAQNPTVNGPSKTHQANPDPTTAERSNPNAPATDKRNNPDQAGPATSSGSGTSSDTTSMNPRNTTEKK